MGLLNLFIRIPISCIIISCIMARADSRVLAVQETLVPSPLTPPTISVQSLEDADIRRNVIYRISKEQRLGGTAIRVKVQEGLVELSGVVNTDAQRRLAEQVARQSKHATGVQNHISISHRQETDIVLENKINTAIGESPQFSQDDIVEATVEKGVATLTGIVGNAIDRKRMLKIAFQEGARSVNARIKTRDDPARWDRLVRYSNISEIG
jgi:osmotically-inducible protein OsmY